MFYLPIGLDISPNKSGLVVLFGMIKSDQKNYFCFTVYAVLCYNLYFSINFKKLWPVPSWCVENYVHLDVKLWIHASTCFLTLTTKVIVSSSINQNVIFHASCNRWDLIKDCEGCLNTAHLILIFRYHMLLDSLIHIFYPSTWVIASISLKPFRFWFLQTILLKWI